MSCLFCNIITGAAPASILYEDDLVLVFPTIRATRPGESLVIPKQHIDHFTDLPDALAAHITLIGQRLGRKMRLVLQPLRVGFIVHGFGVPHAHLIVLPIHHPTDITSARHARHADDGRLVFGLEGVPEVGRKDLDAMASLLRMDGIDQAGA